MSQLLESLGWVVLGFIPTLAAMEFAWRISKRRLDSMEVVEAQ